MADVCLPYDDRLIEATPWRLAVAAAARAQVTSIHSTTATVGGHGPGIAAEI